MLITGGISIYDGKIQTGVLYDYESDIKTLLDEDMIQVDKDTKRTYFPFYHRYKELEGKQSRSEEEDIEMIQQDELNSVYRTMAGRILKCYMARDRQVGYVQGFNSIVGSLLYIFYQSKLETDRLREQGEEMPDLGFKLGHTEEEVFYCFYGFMYVLNWRNNFIFEMEDVQRMCNDFKKLLEEKDKSLHDKFFIQEFPAVVYFASFYLSVCMHITPMEYSAKILDMFLFIGEDTIHYILMGLLISNKQYIMDMDNEEEILNFLKNEIMKSTFKNGCIGSILMFEDWSTILNRK